MASRKLSDLDPELQEIAEEFLQQCADYKIDVLIYCTYRSNEEQDILYEQGRTTEGKIVTYARGGQSKHNVMVDGKPASRAFDCVPCVLNKPNWSAASPQWKVMGEIGRGLGLSCGMDWKNKDSPHFELRS